MGPNGGQKACNRKGYLHPRGVFLEEWPCGSRGGVTSSSVLSEQYVLLEELLTTGIFPECGETCLVETCFSCLVGSRLDIGTREPERGSPLRMQD